MNREEREKAIDLFDNLLGMIDDNQGNDYDFALKKGIEALEQQPCEDCISRTSVFEILGSLMSIPYDFDRRITEKDVSESMDEIRNLSSVTPKGVTVTDFADKCRECGKMKKGKWIMTNDYITAAYGTIDYVKCSCCGEECLEEGNYCPNCGAEMEE